jgi:hypothetical protein
MSTKGNISWQPQSKEHRRTEVQIEGRLEAAEWEDFGQALIDLGKQFNIKVTVRKVAAKKKATKSTGAKKKSVKKKAKKNRR